MKNKKSLRVLIVDDDSLMRSYLRIMLRDIDEDNVLEAGTASKCEKLLKSMQFDLIFLDIVLPDGDGIDFISTILKTLPKCKIIMVSGEATMDRVKHAIQAGASDFIAKPFNAAIVDSKVAHVISEISKT